MGVWPKVRLKIHVMCGQHELHFKKYPSKIIKNIPKAMLLCSTVPVLDSESKFWIIAII